MAARFIAAVDLGATNVRVVIANEDGDIEARRAGPLPGGPPDEVPRKNWTDDRRTRARCLDRQQRRRDRHRAAGHGRPSDRRRRFGRELAGWDDVPIAEMLGKPRGVPVAIENDANAAAVGEGWIGAAKGMRDHRLHRARHRYRRGRCARRAAASRRTLPRRRDGVLPDDPRAVAVIGLAELPRGRGRRPRGGDRRDGDRRGTRAGGRICSMPQTQATKVLSHGYARRRSTSPWR